MLPSHIWATSPAVMCPPVLLPDNNKIAHNIAGQVQNAWFQTRLPWWLVLENLEELCLPHQNLSHRAKTKGHVLITTNHLNSAIVSGNFVSALHLRYFNPSESLQPSPASPWCLPPHISSCNVALLQCIILPPTLQSMSSLVTFINNIKVSPFSPLGQGISWMRQCLSLLYCHLIAWHYVFLCNAFPFEAQCLVVHHITSPSCNDVPPTIFFHCGLPL